MKNYIITKKQFIDKMQGAKNVYYLGTGKTTHQKTRAYLEQLQNTTQHNNAKQNAIINGNKRKVKTANNYQVIFDIGNNNAHLYLQDGYKYTYYGCGDFVAVVVEYESNNTPTTQAMLYCID